MSKNRQTDQRYLLPVIVDPPRKCLRLEIPDDTNHQRAFFAAINELSNAWVWEWDDNHGGVAASAVWTEICIKAANDFYFESGGCMGCDDCYTDIDNTVVTFNTNIITITNWYNSFIAAGGLFITTIIGDAPLMGSGHDTETIAMFCYLSNIWVDAACDAALTAFDDDTNDTFAALGAIAGTAQRAFDSFMSLPLPLYITVGGWFPSVAAGIAQRIFNYIGTVADPDLLAALNDASARAEIACCMKTFLSAPASGARPLSSWNNMLKPSNCSGLSDNGEVLRLFLLPLICDDPVQYTSFYKLLDDDEWLNSTDSLPPCACGDWCYNFDFIVDDGGWVNGAAYDRPFGIYVAATGWQSVWGDVRGTDDERLYIHILNTPNANMTSVELDFAATGTGGVNRRAVLEVRRDNGVVASIINDQYLTDGSVITLTIDQKNETFNEVRLTITGHTGDDDLLITCTRVEVRGMSANPYGADNC